MDDYYENNGNIRKQSDKFRMDLYRRMDRKIDFSFSIKKIQCRNCGGSYDATRQKTCPYCGSKYEIADDDWIVTSIQKV